MIGKEYVEYKIINMDKNANRDIHIGSNFTYTCIGQGIIQGVSPYTINKYIKHNCKDCILYMQEIRFDILLSTKEEDESIYFIDFCFSDEGIYKHLKEVIDKNILSALSTEERRNIIVYVYGNKQPKKHKYNALETAIAVKDLSKYRYICK